MDKQKRYVIVGPPAYLAPPIIYRTPSLKIAPNEPFVYASDETIKLLFDKYYNNVHVSEANFLDA